MADISDIKTERAKREIKKILKEAKNRTDVRTKLHMFGKPVGFWGYAFSGDIRSKDKLSVVVHDISPEHPGVLGFIILDRNQWEKLKATGDILLDGLADSFARTTKNQE